MVVNCFIYLFSYVLSTKGINNEHLMRCPFIFYQVVVEGNENDSHVSSQNEGKQGELQVRGPSVFKW